MKDFGLDNNNFNVLAESKSRKQGAGSLYCDASQRSYWNRCTELWTHSSVPANVSLADKYKYKHMYIYI